MKFFWLIASSGLSAGVILSPAFPFTLLVLALSLFRKKTLTWFAIFFSLGSFLASIHQLSGVHEIVGYATIQRPKYVIATNVKYFSNGKWKRLLHTVKIYSDEVQAGESFYAFGEIHFQFGYPPLIMKPNFIAGARHATRDLEKIHSNLVELKNEIIDLFKENVPEYSDLLTTLVFSDPSFEASEAENIRKSGLAHLFAVSGLHVGIVYVLFDVLVSLFTHNFFIRRPLSVLLTLMFAVMSGPSPSAFRAATMLALWNLFKLIDYPVEPLNLLGLVATLNVLFEPFMVLSPSFLMSYSAVAMLLAVQDRLKNFKGLLTNLMVSIFAFVGVMPFLFLFSMVNLLTPLFSVPAIFIAMLLLWASVSSVFLVMIKMQSAAAILVRGATPLAWALEKLIDLSSKSLILSENFLAYLFSSVLVLFLLWHFGHSPKNFTS